MLKLSQQTQTTLPEEILAKLSTTDKRVALAVQSNIENPKMIDQNKAQWDSMLGNIMLKAQVKLGTKEIPSRESGLIIKCINEDLTKKFPNLTRKEVYLALDAGLDGMFLKPDERVFFNPSNLMQWIKAWVESVKKPAMEKVYQAQAGLPSPQKKTPEKEMLISKYLVFVNATFDYIENGKEFFDIGGFVYVFLRKFEFIEEVSKEFLEATAIHELQVAKIERDKSQINHLNRVIGDITNLEAIDDSPLHGIATRKMVMKKIKEIAQWDQDDITDYFEFIKSTMAEYFKENNL